MYSPQIPTTLLEGGDDSEIGALLSDLDRLRSGDPRMLALAGPEVRVWRPSELTSALTNRAAATPAQAPTRVAAAPHLQLGQTARRILAPDAALQARILVVDDQESQAVRLRQILCDARYTRVETSTDPRAVPWLHRKNPFDLILLDLAMPQMSGFEVMATLRQLDPDGRLPVVAVTSHSSQEVPALRAGARDVVGKPFDEVEILWRIGAVLASRMPEVARTRRYRNLERDLGVAGEVYRALLPVSLPSCPGYEVAVFSESAEDTSGDIHDVVVRANGNLVLLLADATGHGFGPALSATQLRSMVRIALQLGAPLEEIVSVADRQLSADLPPDRFVTAFIGELDPATHTLEYFAPGQGPLLHWHAAARRAEWRNASGPPFGVSLSSLQRAVPMVLAPGDVVVLATDGVFERTDPGATQFGTSGVEAVMSAMADTNARDLTDALRNRVEDHATGSHPDDDLTVVVLRRSK